MIHLIQKSRSGSESMIQQVTEVVEEATPIYVGQHFVNLLDEFHTSSLIP